MDAEPPPFEQQLESPNQRLAAVQDEFARPTDLPVSADFASDNFALSSTSDLVRNTTSSIPEYTSASCSPTFEAKESRGAATIKKAKICNGHITTPALSGISEEPSILSSTCKTVIAPVFYQLENNGKIELEEDVRQDDCSMLVTSNDEDSGHHDGDEPNTPSPNDPAGPEPTHDIVDDDEDFGDFAEFSSAPPPPTEQNWNAFDSTETTSAESGRSVDDEWGDFADPAPAALSKSGTELRASINEQDNWDDADFVSAPVILPSAQVIDLPQLEVCAIGAFGDVEIEDVEATLNRDEGDEAFDLRGILSQDNVYAERLEFLHSCCELWIALRIIEEARALHHQFLDSQLQSIFHRNLGVDKARIARASFLASTMVLPEAALVPTPISAVVVSPSETALNKLSPPKSSPQHSPYTNSHNHSKTPPFFDQPDFTTTSLVVPPADFNWADSGLINPFKSESINHSASLLDVHFSGTGANLSSEAVLQQDLDALGLSSISKRPISLHQNNNSDLVSSLFSSEAAITSADNQFSLQSQTASRQSAELSLDAKALYDQLPDLSVLLSRKIVFPLSPHPSPLKK